MGRRLSPDARRAEIIEVAHATITREGYHSLSLRELARRCEMSAPGLMHYFPDMPTLLEAVLAHRDEADIVAITGADGEERTVGELIEAAAAYYADRLAEVRRFDALEAEALDPSHPAHAWFTERNRRNLELLRPAVEREFDDPDTVMRLLRYVIDGVRLSWMQAPGDIDFVADWTAVGALLDHGLPGRRGARQEPC